MPGLNLQTGFRVQAAAPPSAAGTSITANAYGPASGATVGGGPSTAGYGTVISGVVGIAVLAFIWYSLPR